MNYIRGELNVGTDVDYFKFSGTEGQKVFVEAHSYTNKNISENDRLNAIGLTLVDSSGDQLVDAAGNPASQTIGQKRAFMGNLVLPSDGTYYIYVWNGLNSGLYDLFVWGVKKPTITNGTLIVEGYPDNFNDIISVGPVGNMTNVSRNGWITEYPSNQISAVQVKGLSGNDLIGVGNVVQTTVLGGAGNDTIYGDAANETLFGEAGCDVIMGGPGADIINGGDDNDILYGRFENEPPDTGDVVAGPAGTKCIVQ